MASRPQMEQRAQPPVLGPRQSESPPVLPLLRLEGNEPSCASDDAAFGRIGKRREGKNTTSVRRRSDAHRSCRAQGV